MRKHLVIFTASLAVLVFIIGCPPDDAGPAGSPKVEIFEPEIAKPEPNEVTPAMPEPKEVEPPNGEPDEVDPAKTEPNEADPNQTEPDKTEPNEAEPVKSEPNGIKPAQTESNQTDPNQVKSDQADPNQFESVKTEPNDVEPAKTEPNHVESAIVEPNDTEPNDVEPNDVEPNDVEPNNVEPNAVEPDKVEPNQPVAFHDKCAEILKTFVNKKGMVDYKTLRRKRLKLKALTDEFDNLDRRVYDSWPKNDKIAFWINAYNIHKLNVVTDNYPIHGSRFLIPIWGPNSIRHIEKIINRYKFLVMDEQFRFPDVEARFFCKEFDDPRIFFALTQATLSGPPLRNEPYTGRKLDKQLNDQVVNFLSSPLSFRIDKAKEKVYLSTIFQATWYGKEFISKYGIDRKFKDQQPATRAVLNFITHYVSKETASFLEVENYSVQFIKYDWTINDGT